MAENNAVSLYQVFHDCLKQIETEPDIMSAVIQFPKKIEPYAVIDPAPQSHLHQMVESSIELILTKYHGCSEQRVKHYLQFLHTIQPYLHTWGPKMVSFIKLLVHEIRHRMLK